MKTNSWTTAGQDKDNLVFYTICYVFISLFLLLLFRFYVLAGFDKGMVCFVSWNSLRKHAYSNILKKGKFSEKKIDIFHITAQNIDCEYSLEPPWQGGSNEYPQSMFFLSAKKEKIMYTPVNPSFTK